MATVNVVSGSFTATGTSDTVSDSKGFNLSLSGFGVATVEIQRSFDAGSTWKTVESFTSNAEFRVDEPEPGILWRFECTEYTSGTIAYRLGRVK